MLTSFEVPRVVRVVVVLGEDGIPPEKPPRKALQQPCNSRRAIFENSREPSVWN